MKDHKPAFPRNYPSDGQGHNGMTLRDYFATHCDMGNMDELPMDGGIKILLRPCPIWQDDPLGNARWWADYRAALRYTEADAMMAARES